MHVSSFKKLGSNQVLHDRLAFIFSQIRNGESGRSPGLEKLIERSWIEVPCSRYQIAGDINSTRIAGTESSRCLFCIIDLRALQLIGVVDVDGFPGGEEVEGAEAFAVAVAGVLDAAEG
jgi:hypothetical protein